MVVIVLAAQIVNIAGADQRPAQLAGDTDDLLVALVLDGEAVLLDLEVDVVGAEGPHQLVSVGASVGRADPRSGAGTAARPGTR